MGAHWTEEAKQAAARMWIAGYTAAQISKALGYSRNAVVGIAHRNRDLFPGKPFVEKQARLPKRQPRPQPQAKVRQHRKMPAPEPEQIGEAPQPIEEPIDLNFAPANPVGVLALTNDTCRWPLWTMGENPGPNGLYCGDPTDGGSVWCRHHRTKARAA